MHIVIKGIIGLFVTLYGLLWIDVSINDVATSVISEEGEGEEGKGERSADNINASLSDENGTISALLDRWRSPEEEEDEVSLFPSPLTSSKVSSHHDDVFDHCRLMDIPTWTPELKKILNPSHDPLKDCDRSFVPWTSLDCDGRVRANGTALPSDSVHCFARAIFHAGDYKANKGPWFPVEEEHQFTNDIVEAECRDANATLYQFLHFQVWRSDRKTTCREVNDTTAEEKEESSPSPPSVYVIIFDSISASHGRRVFARSTEYLRQEFGAVDFEHVNKVGDNSRPNGVAFLFGKAIGPLQRAVFGEENIPEDWQYTNFCRNYLNGKGFIMEEFGKANYTTMMAEDWNLGVFNWPNCLGFKAAPTTHYMRPFHNRLVKEKPKLLREWMSTAHCMEHHKHLLEYLEKFSSAYPDKPKFGLTWASYLGHDYASLPFHADQYLLEYFARMRDEFDKSFVFFMGDHGLRFGKLRWSEVGKRDVNNPMLYLSVPRRLRSNDQLMHNLQHNSKQLLTMYDIHATFVDILESLALPSSPPLDFSTTNHKEGHKYCLCEISTTRISINHTLFAIGEAIASTINSRLAEEGVADICHLLKAKEINSVSLINGTSNLYEAVVVTTPGDGKFQTYVRDTSTVSGVHNFSMIVRDATRLNQYGRAADCTPKNSIRPYCYCKSNTAKASSPPSSWTTRKG